MRKPAAMILVLILLVLTGCTNWAAVQEDNSPGGGSESAGAAESVAAGREETVYAGEEVLPAQAADVPSDVALLFQSYGWTATERMGEADVRMPDSLMTDAEDSPFQLYWMRAVVLSGDISCDLKGNLGNDISIEIYNVAGELPEQYRFPVFQTIRGIVLRNTDGMIIGAYLDSGRHAGNAVSLLRRGMEDITGMSLADYWRENYYDANKTVNIDAENRTAEEVIRRYFQGMASGDAAAQLSTLCVNIKISSLFSNADNCMPYNAEPELFHYLKSVEILSIEQYGSENGTLLYSVEIDAETSEAGKAVLGDGGRMTRFVAVGEEGGSLRIFGDGTGP